MEIMAMLKKPFSSAKLRWIKLAEHGYKGFDRFRLFFDMTYCEWRFHTRYFEYFWFNYMNRKNRDRKNFLLFYHQSVGYRLIRKGDERFALKSAQYEFLSDMIRREYIKLNEASFEEIREFSARFGKVLFKPDHGTHGNGILVYEHSEGEERLREILSEISGKAYLCEEYLTQHPEMAKLSASSVNTIRALTLNDNGKVKIIDTAVRMGAENKACDNLCNGGLAATVDVDTGIIVTAGVTSRHERYIYHPVTGEKIVGFNIPLWEELKEMVTKAAERMPDYPVRGWDIAITPDGPCIIEVNSYPGSRLNQLMDQKPKGKEIIEYINKNTTARERRKFTGARRKDKRGRQ